MYGYNKLESVVAWDYLPTLPTFLETLVDSDDDEQDTIRDVYKHDAISARCRYEEVHGLKGFMRYGNEGDHPEDGKFAKLLSTAAQPRIGDGFRFEYRDGKPHVDIIQYNVKSEEALGELVVHGIAEIPRMLVSVVKKGGDPWKRFAAEHKFGAYASEQRIPLREAPVDGQSYLFPNMSPEGISFCSTQFHRQWAILLVGWRG